MITSLVCLQLAFSTATFAANNTSTQKPFELQAGYKQEIQKIKSDEKVIEDTHVNNNTEENPHIKPYTPEAVNDPSTSIKSGKKIVENKED